jgi:hypothetical protein
LRAPDNRPAQRRRPPAFERTPEQAAAAHADALYSQAVWRAECAKRAEANASPPPPPAARRPRPEAEAQRASFAAHVARAELGRFYWQDGAGKKPVKPRKRPSNAAGEM